MDGVEGHKRAHTDLHTHTHTCRKAGAQTHSCISSHTYFQTHFKVESFFMLMVFRDATSFLHLALGITAQFPHQNVKRVQVFPPAHFSASQQSICQSICPPASLFVRPVKARFFPLFPSDWRTICLSVWPSVHLSLPVSLCPLSALCPVNLAVNLSAILSMWLGFISLSICLCIRTMEFGATMHFCGQKALRCFDLEATCLLRLCKQRKSK